jgi:hypothetical protein
MSGKQQGCDRMPDKSHSLGNFSTGLAIKPDRSGEPGRHRCSQGVPTVQKTLTYSLLLAATLGLAACEKTPEEQMKSAQESATEAVESMGDAIEQGAEAAADQVDELLGNEATPGEQLEEAAETAAEAIEDAAEQTGQAIKDAGDAARSAVDGE